ncbi:MAG TPA: glucosyl-3-phosphoglycerate synthase [Actinomycetota bacterium]|nr:glucosyl-3-phosphoglycerate synthase [Actinomycetota bacterium]
MLPTPTEWVERRTFHYRRFDPTALADAKRQQGLTISVCIPALNEEATIGAIVEAIRGELVEKIPLVDELAVIDSSSSDGTADAARDAGAIVHQDRSILPEVEPLEGKGEALWKSLFVVRGDIILWLDADIRNFEPHFVVGPLGPLLTDPSISYVKSFFRRPIDGGTGRTSMEGGRVTELVARPLINMFWPHLAGFIQPLAGEYAGRRQLLEQVPFFTGYGVEIGLLIDIAERFGVDAMAQVDTDTRVHRNRPLQELSRMSFAVMQAAFRRLSSEGRLDPETVRGLGMYQFAAEGEAYRMEPSIIEVRERPPAITVAGYGANR